jgi:flagellar hook-associated protein 3 FlgL
MRISTNMMFDIGAGGIGRQTSTLAHLQEQIAAMKRIVRPSDDPVAAARVVEVQQYLDITDQFATNIKTANASLDLEDTMLDSAAGLIGQIRDLAIQAGSPSLSASARQSIGTSVRALYDSLMAVANRTDGAGDYLFSGFQGRTKPFSGDINTLNAGGEITYSGDDGQRNIQISPSRFVEVSDAGSNIFVRTGNGESVFKTIATLVGVLEAPMTATYGTDINTAVSRLGIASARVTDVRASVGSRGNEVDATASLNSDLALQYKQNLSTLQDLDYAQALTDLTKTQTTLEAAIKSFSSVSQLSLFKYL